MKPNHEDPNNHAPKVSSEDEWDELDSDVIDDAQAAPGERPDRKIPPKKQGKRVLVTRHEGRSERGKSQSEKVKSVGTPKELNKPAGGNRETKPSDKPPVQSSPKAEENESANYGGDIPSIIEGRAGRSRVREISPKKEDLPQNHPAGKFVGKIGSRIEEAKKPEKQKGHRRFSRGERSDWGTDENKNSTKWMIVCGAGIVLLVVLTVVLSQRRNGEAKDVAGESIYGVLEEKVDVEDEVEEKNPVSEILTNGKEVADNLYATFSSAQSAEDLRDIVFRKDAVMPLIEARWKPLGAKSNWNPGSSSVWTPRGEEDIPYGVLSGTDSDYSPFTAYFRDSESGLKLDWKATIGYSSSPFSELREGVGDGSEVRGLISSSEFYTFALPEEDYKSYRLQSPDGNHVLWGYVKRDSETAKKLKDLFVPSEITGEAQTEIQGLFELERGPEESLANQWLLKELTGLSWLDK